MSLQDRKSSVNINMNSGSSPKLYNNVMNGNVSQAQPQARNYNYNMTNRNSVPHANSSVPSNVSNVPVNGPPANGANHNALGIPVRAYYQQAQQQPSPQLQQMSYQQAINQGQRQYNSIAGVAGSNGVGVGAVGNMYDPSFFQMHPQQYHQYQQLLQPMAGQYQQLYQQYQPPQPQAQQLQQAQLQTQLQPQALLQQTQQHQLPQQPQALLQQSQQPQQPQQPHQLQLQYQQLQAQIQQRQQAQLQAQIQAQLQQAQTQAQAQRNVQSPQIHNQIHMNPRYPYDQGKQMPVPIQGYMPMSYDEPEHSFEGYHGDFDVKQHSHLSLLQQPQLQQQQHMLQTHPHLQQHHLPSNPHLLDNNASPLDSKPHKHVNNGVPLASESQTASKIPSIPSSSTSTSMDSSVPGISGGQPMRKRGRKPKNQSLEATNPTFHQFTNPPPPPVEKKKRGRPRLLILDPTLNQYIDSNHPNYKALKLQLKRGENGVISTYLERNESSYKLKEYDVDEADKLLQKKDKRGRPRKFAIEETGITVKGVRIGGLKHKRKKIVDNSDPSVIKRPRGRPKKIDTGF